MTKRPGYSCEEVGIINDKMNMPLDTDSSPTRVDISTSSSSSTSSHDLLTKVSEKTPFDKEEAAQEMAKEMWNNFTAFMKSQSPDLSRDEILDEDTDLESKNSEKELVYNSKTDFVFIETEDMTTNPVTVEKPSAYNIIKADPNSNMSSSLGPKTFVLRNVLSSLDTERKESDGESAKILVNKEDEEDILNTDNLCNLKQGDEVFVENTSFGFKILSTGPSRSYCTQLYTKSVKNETGVKRYRIGKQSTIKDITVGFDSLSTPLEPDEKRESPQDSSDPAGPSMVPNNTPQDVEHEDILPELIPEMEKMSIELKQCTKLFEKLTIPVETQGSEDDPRAMMKNKKAKSSIFPKFIKCNGHGVGGTCPIAKNPVPESDEKEASEIMLLGRAHQVNEYEMEVKPGKKNSSSFGLHFENKLHTPNTTQSKSKKSQGPDKIKRVVKVAKFKPTFAVKISRPRPRRASINKRTKSCFCLCMAGSSKSRGPLDCFTDCFRPRRRSNGLRKNPNRDEPRTRGNKANDARHQNTRNFPQVLMPGFPIHPFNHLPVPIIYNDNFEAGFYEEIGEEFAFPRPNRDDFLYDEENFYEGFYGEPIVFAPVRGAVHISIPGRMRPMPGDPRRRVFHHLNMMNGPMPYHPQDQFDHHDNFILLQNLIPAMPVIPDVNDNYQPERPAGPRDNGFRRPENI